MAMVLPDCNVDAPPVVILAFAADVAPPSLAAVAAQHGSGGNAMVHDDTVPNAIAVASNQERSRQPDDDRAISTFVVVTDDDDGMNVNSARFGAKNRGVIVKQCASFVMIPIIDDPTRINAEAVIANLMVGFSLTCFY